MQTRWTGCGTALVTPFAKTGALDEAAVTRLARRQIDAGVHFLVPCGTTGESPTLSRSEKLRVIELVVAEADGKVPVLAGVGGFDTRSTAELARDVTRLGVESTDLPIVLYNVPSRTGCNIDLATLLRLTALPNIVGVKEASGNLEQMAEFCRAVPDDFSVLSGDDAFTLPLMAIGGRGVISVVSNEVPSEMANLVQAALDNDFSTAGVIAMRLLPLMQVNFVESNPIPVKAAMAAMGLIDACYRLPLVPPQLAARERIVAVLKELGLSADQLHQTTSG